VTLEYRFDLTCPACDGDLDHRDGTAVIQGPCRTGVEVWCSRCLIVFQVVVEAYALHSMPPAGDQEAARRRRAGENLGGLGPAVFS
jgi:hypothetical protein